MDSGESKFLSLQNPELKIIDLTRSCHANSSAIDVTRSSFKIGVQCKFELGNYFSISRNFPKTLLSESGLIFVKMQHRFPRTVFYIGHIACSFVYKEP